MQLVTLAWAMAAAMLVAPATANGVPQSAQNVGRFMRVASVVVVVEVMQLSNHDPDTLSTTNPKESDGVHPVTVTSPAVALLMRSAVKVLVNRIADVAAAFVIAHVWRNPWPRQEDHRR